MATADQRRAIADLRKQAARMGFTLTTAADLSNKNGPDQEASDLGRDSNRKRSNKQDK